MTEASKPESSGDPMAELGELFAALETPLLNYAISLVQKPDIAQDLVQDAFLRLHERMDEVREPKAWLYRTVHNLAMSHHRKHSRVIRKDSPNPPMGMPCPMNASNAWKPSAWRCCASTGSRKMPVS